MLVLSLSIDEVVHIGDDIQIVYKGPGKNPNQISVGFDAPRSVNIRRESLIDNDKSVPDHLRQKTRRRILEKGLLNRQNNKTDKPK